MRRRYFFYTLLFFLFYIGIPIGVFSQQVIRGVIFDHKTSLRVSGAIIQNVNNRALVKSNEFGIFQIQGNVSDTLAITKSGFTEYLIKVTSTQDLFIRLQQVIRLSEVTVTAQSKKEELDDIRTEFKKKSYFGGKPPVLAYVFHPITALYETFGKEPGMAKRFNQFYVVELQQTEVSRRFNATVVKRLTTLEDKDLQPFTEIYRPQYDVLSNWDDYELIKYIKTSADAYIKAGRPPSGIKGLPKLPTAPDLGDKEIKLKKLRY